MPGEGFLSVLKMSTNHIYLLLSDDVMTGRCHEMELFSPGQLALRIQGELLTDDSASLSAMGIAFGSRGAQLQDIYMYVPHLIS